MKHIGWCLDRIQIAVKDIPKTLSSAEDITLAHQILDEVQGYAVTLAQIIHNPKFTTYLKKLEECSIEEIRLQAHEIEALVRDLEQMLKELNAIIRTSRTVITDAPDRWMIEVQEILLGAFQK